MRYTKYKFRGLVLMMLALIIALFKPRIPQDYNWIFISVVIIVFIVGLYYWIKEGTKMYEDEK